MALTDVLQFLSDMFMVITVPIYIMYLITLFKNRKDETLKSSFFKLMFSVGIADVGTIFTLILGNVLAGSGLVPEAFIFLGGLSARLSTIGIYGFGLSQTFGVFFVAFNRYTAYMLPMKHAKLWTDTVVRNLIIAQWMISFIGISPLLFYVDFTIFVEADNKTILLQWTNSNLGSIYNLFISGIISGILAIIILLVYAIIFLTAVKRKIVSKQPMSKVEKTALKMAITGFIASIGLFVFLFDALVLELSWYLFHIDFPAPETFWLIFNVGNSIYSSVNPYAMFIFSATVRNRFAALFCHACHQHSEQIATVTTSPARIVIVQPSNS